MKVRSAKGIMVDFDLMRIKETIASSEESVEVRGRQDFIDTRLRRRIKKVEAPAPAIEPVEKSEAGVPGVDNIKDELIEEEIKEEEIDTSEEDTPKKKPVRKTKQKARGE